MHSTSSCPRREDKRGDLDIEWKICHEKKRGVIQRRKSTSGLRNQEGGGIQDRTKSSGRILTTQTEEGACGENHTTAREGDSQGRAHRLVQKGGHPQKCRVRSEKGHLLKQKTVNTALSTLRQSPKTVMLPRDGN